MANEAVYPENFLDLMDEYIGETVTIFTTSGGQSGLGFTGVIMEISPDFIRLITHIGAAPRCALGNSCGCCHRRNRDNFDNSVGNIGSIVDIPLDKIAAFVHNAV